MQSSLLNRLREKIRLRTRIRQALGLLPPPTRVYVPSEYWDNRFKYLFNLRGVGSPSLSEKENRKLYQIKEAVIRKELDKLEIDIRQQKIIEIGCGVGVWAQMFKDMGCLNYTGMDISRFAVESLGKKFPEYKFMEGDISEVKPGGSFDLILMIDVTQHIVDDHRFEAAMRNISECINQGGRFFVTSWLDPNARSCHDEKSRDISAYRTAFKNYRLSEPIPFGDKYLLVISR